MVTNSAQFCVSGLSKTLPNILDSASRRNYRNWRPNSTDLGNSEVMSLPSLGPMWKMGIDDSQTFLYLSKQGWYYKIVLSIYQCRHNAKIFWCRDFQMISFCLIMIDAKSLWTSWLFCITILFLIFEGNKVEFKFKKYSEDYCGGN